MYEICHCIFRSKRSLNAHYAMKKDSIVPGIRYILKEYHEILLIILEEWKQTQKDAANELGISVTTFQKILRLKSLPNFHTPRGKILAQRFERWSGGIDIRIIFPEAFFTKEFLRAPKTHIKSVPFRLISRGRNFTLALPAKSSPPPQPQPAKRNRRKKRKANKR